jgi:hypothetical protein
VNWMLLDSFLMPVFVVMGRPEVFKNEQFCHLAYLVHWRCHDMLSDSRVMLFKALPNFCHLYLIQSADVLNSLDVSYISFLFFAVTAISTQSLIFRKELINISF